MLYRGNSSGLKWAKLAQGCSESQLRLILNFSKLFLKNAWKYGFFIYLCSVVLLNVSKLVHRKYD